MNKKFSTLAAACLAAGAMMLSVDASAQVRYAEGKAYGTVTEKTALPASTLSDNYFIVFNNAGTDYVTVVNGSNGLDAVPFATAKMDQIVKITENATKYNVVTGANQLGFATGGTAFGADITDLVVELTSGALKFAGESNGSITLTGTTFAATTSNANTFTAKAVAVSALEAIKDNVATVVPADTKIGFGSTTYLLMDNGNVLAGAADGTATWGADDKTQKNYWTIELTENGNNAGTVKFKNKATGKYLVQTAAGAHITAAVTRAAADQPYKFADNGAIALVGGTFNGISNIALGVVAADGQALTAGQLNSILGDGFQMDIKKYVDGDKKDKTVAENPFQGALKPVKFNNTTDYAIVDAATGDDSYMLMDKDGNLIVLDTDYNYAQGSGEFGCKVTTITPKALAYALKSTKTEVQNRYAYNFSIKAADDFVVGKNQAIAKVNVANKANTSYKLGNLDVQGVPTLAATADASTYLSALTIKVGKFNTVSLSKLFTTTPTFYTVTNKNTKKTATNYNKVLGLDEAGDAAFVKSADALVGYPETQWALTYNAGTNMLTFTNRENTTATESFDVAKLYNTDKANIYAINGDTIEIKPLAKYAESDGYLRLNANDLRDQKYYVGAYSSVFENVAYWVENHKDNHQIGMDINKNSATEWNLDVLRYTDNSGMDPVVRIDTVMVGSTLGYWDADNNKVITTDEEGDKTVFLKLLAYSFQNSGNNEYFAYTTNSFTTGKEDDKNGYKKEDANYFAIKLAGEDVYKLIQVEGAETEMAFASTDAKIYSGDGASKGILNHTGMYTQTENDLFVVEKKDAPEYRKVAMGDTVKVFRNESTNEAQVLFEKGEFLSIANAVQFPNTNPALYVDTAYVDRGSNNRWEYLLAVNAKHWDSKVDCDIPGHPKHESDTTTGRFLVNLMDSAYVYGDNNLHNNKFINEEDGESYAKLGFVEGYHTHDTLYLQRPNGTYAELPMNREDYSHSMAKYAFRYVDQEQGSFVIETGRKDFSAEDEARGVVGTGYLKWLNGVVVVVDDIKKADVFNMNENETRIPTNNEGVSATEVSIIAGAGSVNVKGAAGKSVAISNILGQTIVNTVLTSDNAIISVPAGIVVVAVEGEEAVKTVIR